MTRWLAGDPTHMESRGQMRGSAPNRQLLLGVVAAQRLQRLFATLFDDSEFLSPHGLRSISAYHREHPYALEVEGVEATTGCSAATPKWRGPVWFLLNYLRVSALERYFRFFGDAFTVEYPTGFHEYFNGDNGAGLGASHQTGWTGLTRRR